MATKRMTKGSHLPPRIISEIGAHYETGEYTNKELAKMFDVHYVTISRLIKKYGWKKPENPIHLAHKEKIEKEIQKSADKDAQMTAVRIRETKEECYKYPKALSERIMREILQCEQKDEYGQTRPYESVIGNIKTLKLALDGVKVAKEMRYAVLGLDDENSASDEIPELIIQEMTANDVEAIRKAQEEDFGMRVDGPEDED